MTFDDMDPLDDDGGNAIDGEWTRERSHYFAAVVWQYGAGWCEAEFLFPHRQRRIEAETDAAQMRAGRFEGGRTFGVFDSRAAEYRPLP